MGFSETLRDFLVGGVLVASVGALASGGKAGLAAIVATMPVKDLIAVHQGQKSPGGQNELLWGLLMSDIAVTLSTVAMIAAQQQDFGGAQVVAVGFGVWLVAAFALVRPF